jgi:hypothetical protein
MEELKQMKNDREKIGLTTTRPRLARNKRLRKRTGGIRK